MRAKRFNVLQFVLTAAMVTVLVLPMFPGAGYQAAHASETGGSTFTVNQGTLDDPYRIATLDDLMRFSYIVMGTKKTACAVLVADIDMQDPHELDFQPIGYKNNSGQEYPFEGTFDGQGHTIKNIQVLTSSLASDRNTAMAIGLFGIVNGVVKNVRVEDTDIDVDKPIVGGVAGINRGTIENCYHSGTVTGTGGVGGVVGHNMAGGIVRNCYNTGKISANTGSSNVGGVAGINEGTVEKCFNTGLIGNTENNNVGGIAGKLAGTDAIIEDCYNSPQDKDSTSPQIIGSSNVGGIVGFVEGNDSGSYIVRNCYNMGIVSAENNNSGGIIGNVGSAGSGNPTVTVVSSYFSEGTDNKYGKLITASEMQQIDICANWDFDRVWRLIDGHQILRFLGSIIFDDRITIDYNGEITYSSLSPGATITVPYKIYFGHNTHANELSYIIANKAYDAEGVSFKAYGKVDDIDYDTPSGSAKTATIKLPENIKSTDCIYLVAEFVVDNYDKYSSNLLVVYPSSAATTLPAAKTLTYNGTAQELVTAGAASGGTMKYALGKNATDAPTDGWGASVPSGTNAGTYYVWYKVAGDTGHADTVPACVTAGIGQKTVTVAANAQTIREGGSIQTGVDYATLSDAVTGHSLSDVTLAVSNGKITASDAAIQDGSGNKVTGNYSISYATGDLTVLAKISRKVTFKVENGSWDDETLTGDQTVTLNGYEDEALKLKVAQIPVVGNKPNDTFKAGSWDITPSTETAITQNTVYTYTYAEKSRISAEVVFSVANGLWDDGTADAKNVLLEGLEGDTLKLTAAQIPAVGNKPNDTYKAGSWNVEPTAETAFANGSTSTYTYTYAAKDAISAAVTFKVVNGSWDDENSADITVTLTGLEGDTLKLAEDQIPAVGNKPDDTFKAGAWDVVPSTETAITAPTVYTYTYAPKDRISVTVTLKVVHGAWDDGTREDKTIVLTGLEGDELRLTLDDMPGVTKPDEGYSYALGEWTPDEPPINFKGMGMGDPITEDTTFTFTYGAKTPVSHTVTFKAVNGVWNDGTTEDKTVTLAGYEGDDLKLAEDQIPAVGNKPANNYKTGNWDVLPSTETTITGDTTYTYTYAPKDGISQTVTFKVVGGSWNNGNSADITVTLTGREGDILKLTAKQIPAVGGKPYTGYKAGGWDVTPNTATAITAPTTYTYTYAFLSNVTTKTETTGLIVVPAELADKYPTLEALKQDMLLKLVVEGEPARMGNTVFYDVELMVSQDDGVTWIPATEENFPTDGLMITLPYPPGTSAKTHNFAAAHMFTLTSARLGTVAGEIEYPPVTAAEDGLHVLLRGLSPVAIAYEPIIEPEPEPKPPIDPTKFEDVAVPGESFTFTKKWEGGSEKSIDFTLYKIDGSVYHHGFDKKAVSNREWRYNAWFSGPAACYVIEKPIPGYITRYVNVGIYSQITDRCCDGGTIINKKIPKTGDEANLALWIGCAAIGIIGIATVLVISKKRKQK